MGIGSAGPDSAIDPDLFRIGFCRDYLPPWRNQSPGFSTAGFPREFVMGTNADPGGAGLRCRRWGFAGPRFASPQAD